MNPRVTDKMLTPQLKVAHFLLVCLNYTFSAVIQLYVQLTIPKTTTLFRPKIVVSLTIHCGPVQCTRYSHEASG